MIIAAGDKKKFARMLPRLMPTQLGTPRSLLFFSLLFFSFFGFCMISPGEATASTSFVREISFSSDGSSEKVTIALSRPAAYKVNFLNHNPKANIPYRLYFDLSNTTFAKGVNRHLKVQGDCVRVVRSALNRSRTVRVVLELKHKVNGDDYKVIKRDNPPALEIILNSKKIIARAGKIAKPVAKAPSSKTPVVEKPAQVAVPKKKPEKKEPRIRLIAVDAGHGGRDPGAVGYRGFKEKKVSLAIALALQKAIDKRPGYKAVMTRTSDSFISLEDRAKLAGEKKADLLISVHGNSHSDARINGVETYYLNFSSNDDARKVAARENFTTPEKVGDLELILFDLMQSDKTNVSSLLAGYVQSNIKDVMAGRYKNFRNLGVKHAPMRVLIEAEMPGILIETGFISNAKESARLRTTAYHRQIAEAIVDGIHDFFTSSKTAAYRKP
jgi:N-acetylmuramoyl-L-alanine amidase